MGNETLEKSVSEKLARGLFGEDSSCEDSSAIDGVASSDETLSIYSDSKICVHFGLSRLQRERESKYGQGVENGTKGFEDKGCYDCNGFNSGCICYFPFNDLG